MSSHLISPDAEPTSRSSVKIAAPTATGAKPSKRTPELEAALGVRIRAARVGAHMSQGALGQAIGVSFQQMQKYELGKDRVAASTLQGIATALGVHPGSFFDDATSAPVGGIPEVREAMAVAADWQRIRSSEARRRVAALISTLAREDQIGFEG